MFASKHFLCMHIRPPCRDEIQRKQQMGQWFFESITRFSQNLISSCRCIAILSCVLDLFWHVLSIFIYFGLIKQCQCVSLSVLYTRTKLKILWQIIILWVQSFKHNRSWFCLPEHFNQYDVKLINVAFCGPFTKLVPGQNSSFLPSRAAQLQLVSKSCHWGSKGTFSRDDR